MTESLGLEIVGADDGWSKTQGKVNSGSTSKVCSKQGLNDKDGHRGAGIIQVGSDWVDWASSQRPNSEDVCGLAGSWADCNMAALVGGEPVPPQALPAKLYGGCPEPLSSPSWYAEESRGSEERGTAPTQPHHPTLLDSEGLGTLKADKRTECPQPACQVSRRGLCLLQEAGRLLEEMDLALSG